MPVPEGRGDGAGTLEWRRWFPRRAIFERKKQKTRAVGIDDILYSLRAAVGDTQRCHSAESVNAKSNEDVSCPSVFDHVDWKFASAVRQVLVTSMWGCGASGREECANSKASLVKFYASIAGNRWGGYGSSDSRTLGSDARTSYLFTSMRVQLRNERDITCFERVMRRVDSRCDR